MSTVPTPALAFAFMLGVATTAYAATGEFGNMCSWGLANHKDGEGPEWQPGQS